MSSADVDGPIDEIEQMHTSTKRGTHTNTNTVISWWVVKGDRGSPIREVKNAGWKLYHEIISYTLRCDDHIRGAGCMA